MTRFARAFAPLLLVCACAASGQVIEFESKGLRYQTLTKSGVTVMYAHLANHVRAYSVIQVAISNGSLGPYVIRPEDFTFERTGGAALRGVPARQVVSMLIEKGGRNDVIKLVSTYETALYGITNMRVTNGYESRRQAALAETSVRLKAAAAASAIALVQTKLGTGESTDGAVFFATDGKPLGQGRLVVRTNTDVFSFNPE